MVNKESKQWVVTVFEQDGPEKINSYVFKAPTEDKANDIAKTWAKDNWDGHDWVLHHSV